MAAQTSTRPPARQYIAVLAVEEPVVDEVAAERRVVVEERARRSRSPPARRSGRPGSNSSAIRSSTIRRFASFVGISVRRPSRKNVRSTVSSSSFAAPEREAGVARRADLLGRPSERLGVQPVGAAIAVQAGDAGRREAVQVLADPRRSAARGRSASAAARASTARQGAGDRQALGVGQRAKDVVGGLGHVGSYPYHARDGAHRPAAPHPRAADRHRRAARRSPPTSRSGSRDRIEEAVRELELREPLWLGKEKLTDHGRCEGKFAAAISGEAPPFEHSPKSAAGVLLHKAIEVEVGARDGLDPHAVAETARRAARRARGAVRRVLARPGCRRAGRAS